MAQQNYQKGVWRDESFPYSAVKLYSPSSKVGYDYANMAVFFTAAAADADADALFTLMHVNHYYKFGTDLRPHMHWIQSSADIPAVVLKYRLSYNGQAPDTTWKTLEIDSHAFPYTSGTICQISGFEDIPGITSDNGVSAMIDFRITRDAASDSLASNFLMKQFDVHISVDAMGSYSEFIKERTYG